MATKGKDKGKKKPVDPNYEYCGVVIHAAQSGMLNSLSARIAQSNANYRRAAAGEPLSRFNTQLSHKYAWVLRRWLEKNEFVEHYPNMDERHDEAQAKHQRMTDALNEARATFAGKGPDKFNEYKAAPKTNVGAYTFEELLEYHQSALDTVWPLMARMRKIQAININLGDDLEAFYEVKILILLHLSNAKRRGTIMEAVPFLFTRAEWESIRETPPSSVRAHVREKYKLSLEEKYMPLALNNLLFLDNEWVNPDTAIGYEIAFSPYKALMGYLVSVHTSLPLSDTRALIATHPILDDDKPDDASTPPLVCDCCDGAIWDA